MKPTSDSFFVDSNIFIYLFGDDDDKKNIAKALLAAKPVISIQVISENMNVLFKKFSNKLSEEQIKEHKNNLLHNCVVIPLTVPVLQKAFEIKLKYVLQWYDSLIISAAFLYGCSILYSEDLQHNQLKPFKIVNPFL